MLTLQHCSQFYFLQDLQIILNFVMWVVPFSKNPMAHMVLNFNSIWMNYDFPHKFQKHFILQTDFRSSIFPQLHGNFVILNNNNNNIHIFVHRTINVQFFNKKNPYSVIKPLSIYWMDEIWIAFWRFFLHQMVDEYFSTWIKFWK